jgi:hypothetical protein
LRWAVVGIFPVAGHAADSLLDTTLEDTKLYFISPLRWDEEDWLYFGGALVAIGAAHSFDERVRDHFATGSKAILNGGEDKNSLRDAAPTVALVAGTGLYAAFIDDRDGYRETWSLIEAGAFSGATAEVLGYATGRERPDATHSLRSIRQSPLRSGPYLRSQAMMSTDGFAALSAMEWQVRQLTCEPARMSTGCRTASPAPHSELRPRDLY